MVETLFPETKKTSVQVSQEILHDLSYWEKLFQKMNFPGMDLVEATIFPVTLLEKINRRKQYKRVKRDFLKYLAYNYVTDLRELGLDEDSIFYFKKGIVPDNFNVHLKIPFDYTGVADFSNLILIQNRPFHEEIHRFIDMQMDGMGNNMRPVRLYIPVPPGKVYMPATNYNGSGGKGKHDRSVYAGFSEDAFKTLAQKTMPGR